MPLRHLILAITIIIVWGGNFPVAKFGVAELPPIFLLSLRFWLIALLVVPFVKVPWPYMPRIILLAGVLGVAHFAFMFTGFSLVDASTAALASQSQVPFATLLAVVVFGERPSVRRLLGTAIALAGVVVIAIDPNMGGSLLGIGMILLASFLWAIANIQLKALAACPPMALHAWMALFAAPAMTLLSLLVEDHHRTAIAQATWVSAAVVVYMAVAVGIFGYSSWQWLLARYPVSLLMPLTLLLPISGVIGSVLVHGEALGLQRVIGGLITIAGVALLVWEPKRKLT